MNDVLRPIKPLSNDQYEAAVNKAILRIRQRIGERPIRAQFKREFARVWGVLDYLAIIIFIAAFVVSSTHIVTHMGVQASLSFDRITQSGGLVLEEGVYIHIHQIGMILLAESAMILFMVMHGISSRRRKITSVPLWLALIAAAFVFVANWQSEIGVMEALMPPIFTIGIGLRLEYLIVISIERANQVQERYLEALRLYELATQSPQDHPHYGGVLKGELWSAIAAINREYRDAPAAIKQLAVRRELMRDSWMHEAVMEVPTEWMPPAKASPVTLPQLEEETQPIAMSPTERMARAREVLKQQPDISVRDMGMKLGTSKSTAGSIIKSIRQETQT